MRRCARASNSCWARCTRGRASVFAGAPPLACWRPHCCWRLCPGDACGCGWSNFAASGRPHTDRKVTAPSGVELHRPSAISCNRSGQCGGVLSPGTRPCARTAAPWAGASPCGQAGTRSNFLTTLDETHTHAIFAGHLARKPFGASPQAETWVVIGDFRVLPITMRAPAVAVFGAGEFRAAAQLRAAGKAAGKIRPLAVSQRGKDVAAANLVTEEKRRCRNGCRIGGLCRHPVDSREMKAADAARLMAARTGDIVQAALEAADRTDVLQRHAVARRLPQGRDDIILLEERSSALTFRQAECRLQVRGCKADRRRNNRALRQKLVGYQNRAAVELTKMPGIKQPGPEFALEIFVRQDPVAVNLVFERRFFVQPGLRAVAEHFQKIIGTEIA